MRHPASSYFSLFQTSAAGVVRTPTRPPKSTLTRTRAPRQAAKVARPYRLLSRAPAAVHAPPMTAMLLAAVLAATVSPATTTGHVKALDLDHLTLVGARAETVVYRG